MPGPLPSPDRRRSNADGAFIVLADRVGDPPAVPSGLVWSAEILEWWAVAWGSPMGSQWHVPVDVPVVARYCQLWQTWVDWAQGEDVDPQFAAMVALEDRLGLSAMARRKLRWSVDVGPGAVSDRVRARRRSDPRLRVVRDGPVKAGSGKGGEVV